MAVDFTETKSERDMEQELANLLEGNELSDSDDAPRGVSYVSSFDDSLLTRNKGLVVRLDNGAEFQVTIVQSKHADGFDPDEEGDDDDA